MKPESFKKKKREREHYGHKTAKNNCQIEVEKKEQFKEEWKKKERENKAENYF